MNTSMHANAVAEKEAACLASGDRLNDSLRMRLDQTVNATDALEDRLHHLVERVETALGECTSRSNVVGTDAPPKLQPATPPLTALVALVHGKSVAAHDLVGRLEDLVSQHLA